MVTAPRLGLSAPLRSGDECGRLGRWIPTLLLIAAAALLTLVAQRETALGMVDLWRRSSTYAYAWLVLPAIFFLLWHNRDRLASLTPTCSLWAIVPAALAALLGLAGELANIGVVREFALAASIAMIVLAAVGWRAFWRLSPYVALLFFCVPAGEILLEPLKTAAVTAVRIYTAALGIGFEQDGFSILVGANRYVIIDDCAGVEHAIAGCFIGLVLGLLVYDHPLKAAAFGAVGGLAGVASNWIRILSIISYDQLNGSQMTLEQHRAFEAPAVVLSFVVLLVVFSRLRRSEAPAAVGTSEAMIRRWLRPTAVAGATLPMLLVSALSPAMSPGAATLQARDRIADWTRHDMPMDVPIDWSPRALTPGVESLIATFNDDRGERSAAVFVAEAKSPRDKVSGGAVDLVGSRAWLPAVEERVEACADARCFEVMHLKLLQGKQGVRHLYVAYVIGAEVVATPLEFRLRRAWSALRGRGDAARVVAVAVDSREELPAADVAAFVRAFAPEERGEHAPEIGL